jgi:hypothetical protein
MPMMIVRSNHKNSQQHKKLMLHHRSFVSKRHLSFIQKYPFLPNFLNSRNLKLVQSLEFTTMITNPHATTSTSTSKLSSNSTSTTTTTTTTHGTLTDKIQAHAWKKIEMTSSGERIFHLDPLPMANKDVYHQNTETTADWLFHTITSSSTTTTTTTTSNRSHDSNNTILYIGFEAFYHMSFDRLGEELKTKYPDSILVFSPLVKSTREYIQNKPKYDGMESTVLTPIDWDKRTIVHLGASHAMDKVIFNEDAEGHLQKAWNEGRLILFTPELAVVDEYVYRANLYQILHKLLVKLTHKGDHANALNDTLPTIEKHCDIKRIIPCDYDLLDQDILETKQRVAEAQNMDEAFAEVYSLLSTYISREHLDCICYFDSGSESFRLYKSVSKLLDSKDMKIPWTRTGLIHARNAAIGDALHTFYATAPEAFPFIVTGDTAALLAGGISMINLHSHNRFGVVVVLNNRGMAIEDVISKRSVDGHQFQYEYVKLDRKRDIFSLDQLKSVIDKDVLSALRDHLWGVSANRAKAIVLNIDVQSLAKETSRNVPSDIISMKGSYLDDDFGERYVQLKEPRTKLEEIIDVLYEELNEASARSIGSDCHHSAKVPVKVVGCSAIEYMEVVSQLSMTSRQKLQFLPKPTDLLATRTLLPSLVESTRRTVSAAFGASNFINSNYTFSVFISNAVFGLDGLNNLISTHLEYGTGTLIHLAYDAAEVVSHYSLIGQVHRNFGIRPSEILPSLYRNHQMYDGQILVIRNSSSDAEKNVADVIRDAIRNPDIKVILMDMGAPNLTESLK